jgi:hypothetical protein
VKRVVLAQSIFVDLDCFTAISSQPHVCEATAYEEGLQKFEVDFVVIDKQYSRLLTLGLDTLYLAFALTA